MKHAAEAGGVKLYEAKGSAEFPNAELIRELERVFLLKTIDRKWMNHIDDMDQLRQGESACRPMDREIRWWNTR